MERIAISFNVLPEMPGKREALVCCIPLQAQRDEHARRCRTPFCTGLFCIAYAPLNRIRIFTGVVKKRRGGGVCRYCGNTKRSDCVYEQVAKLGPVSRAAGMDCECPLYNISVIKQKIKQKGKAEKMSGFRML